MALFGRGRPKKVEKKEVEQEDDDVEDEIDDIMDVEEEDDSIKKGNSQVKGKIQGKSEEATETRKDVKEGLKAFSDGYNGIYNPSSIFQVNPVILDAEKMSMQFAIYNELRLLNEKLQSLIDKE